MRLVYSVPISICEIREEDLDCLGLKRDGSDWVYQSKGFRILGYWIMPDVVLEIMIFDGGLSVELGRIDIRNNGIAIMQYVDMRLRLDMRNHEGMTLVTQEFQLGLKKSRGPKGVMKGKMRKLENYIEVVCSGRICRAVNRTLKQLSVMRSKENKWVVIKGTGDRKE